MKYEEVYDDFIKAVPESASYCREKKEIEKLDEDDGMHIYYWLVVTPYIHSVMKSGNEVTMKKIADFFEKMETSGDHLIAEVFEQSVVETLLSNDRPILGKWWGIYGPETKDAIRAVARWY